MLPKFAKLLILEMYFAIENIEVLLQYVKSIAILLQSCKNFTVTFSDYCNTIEKVAKICKIAQ